MNNILYIFFSLFLTTEVRVQTVKKVEVERRGTYSIVYFYDDDPYRYALDWAFTPTDGRSKNDGKPAERKWFASVKDGEEWCSREETDEKMHEILLEHFGLSDWKAEFPLKEMLTISPRHLAHARREKEKKNPKLERHEMKSGTAGFDILAENYCG